MLGTSRVFLAVGKLLGVRVCSTDDTRGDPTLGLTPPCSLLRLQLGDVKKTATTILGDKEFVSCGKFTARLVPGKPESLLQDTGGSAINLIVVPLMQLQHCLRNGGRSLLINEQFAKEAGLVMSVQDAEPVSLFSLPISDAPDADEECDNDQSTEHDSRGNRWPIGLVLACVELSPLIKKAEDFKEMIELAAKSYSLAQSRAGTYCDDNAHIESV